MTELEFIERYATIFTPQQLEAVNFSIEHGTFYGVGRKPGSLLWYPVYRELRTYYGTGEVFKILYIINENGKSELAAEHSCKSYLDEVIRIL